MSKVERYDDKDQFLEALGGLRPDLFFPEQWTPEERTKAVEAIRPRQTRASMFSSIPMKCTGPACPFQDTCPLMAQNLAPINKPCHPPGTLIRTTMGDVPIEDLDSNQHLVWGWERTHNAIRKRPGFGFQVAQRHFAGLMVTVSAGGHSHDATFDHLSAARFNTAALEKSCVYLMRKGDFWRVGRTKLLRSSAGGLNLFGPGMRASKEGADELWILGVYDGVAEAALMEEYFSVTGQIAKACFVDSLKKIDSKHDGYLRWVTEEQLLAHHKSLLQESEHYARFLNDIGLSIHYPIWRKGGFGDGGETNRFGLGNAMFIRATNLISGCMDVPVLSEGPRFSAHRNFQVATWEPVAVEKYRYHGNVYSLDVERHKTYFADSIATHNCPLEMAMVSQFMQEYMEELGVDPENLIEVSMVRDLVDQEVQYLRKTKTLAKEHFITENVVGVDPQGNVVMRKELHLAVELEDKLHKRKKDLRNQLLATREARARVGQTQLDTAQAIANIMDNVREIQHVKEQATRRALGTLYKDDYVEDEAPEAEVVDD